MRYPFQLFFVFFSLVICSACQQSEGSSSDVNTKHSAAKMADFTGHWSFEIDGGWVGWLSVEEKEGYLDGELLWKWGSVRPVANIYIRDNNTLHATRVSTVKRESNREHYVTSWLEATVDGDQISGFYYEPERDGSGVDSTRFSGYKTPPLPQKPALSEAEYGDPVELFNGKDLSGWELINEDQTNGFKVVDGFLYNDAVKKPGEENVNYGNLRTVQEFEDFNLKLDVNVPEGSNSGIYLRGMYEIQVNDSYGKPLDSHHMGAVYSRITPNANAEKEPGEWQTFDITLYNRHITVILNGVTIIDNQPVEGPTGGALSHKVNEPGPLYLQGDHGPVWYRNIILTPIDN